MSREEPALVEPAIREISAQERLRLVSHLAVIAHIVPLALIAVSAHAQQAAPSMPMQPVVRDGAAYRQLQKKVLNTRLLDGMEDLTHCSFQGVGSMTLSTAEVVEGGHSLRIASTDNIGRVDGSGDWQDLVATRNFPSEDWRPWNRISV